ncbi:MAG: hypothetical protein ACRENX_10955 [Candidatus Dormibacteria bacterium]
MSREAQRFRSPWLPCLALGASAVFLAWGGYFLMFFHFSPYDDEGYLLISLQSFLRGGHLYSQVYSEYGPFFHEVMGALFSIPGFGVSPQHGREVTLGIWVVCSCLVGVCTLRLTRSWLLGLAAEWTAFSLLFVLIKEPLHPVGLLSLQAALLLVVVAFVLPRHRRTGLLLVGALVGSILMVKANIGAFTAVAVFFWLSANLASPTARRWLLTTASLAMAGGPVALIVLLPSPGWGDGFGVLLALAGAALALVSSSLSAESRSGRVEDLAWALGGGLALSAMSVAVIFALGTSPAAVVTGTLVAPLAHPQGFYIPLHLSPADLALSAMTVPVAGLYLLLRRSTSSARRAVRMESLLRLVIGVLILLAATSSDVGSATLVWIIVLPPRGLNGVPASRSVSVSQRLALAVLALLWTLNVYPVNGSQRAIAELPALMVGLLAIGDAWQAHRSLLPSAGSVRARGLITGALVAIVVLLVAVFSDGQLIIRGYTTYRTETPLRLAGSAGIRLPSSQVAQFRTIVNQLHAHCSTFFSEPGFNSLYFFSGDKPPTLLNSSSWIVGMNSHQQAEIVRQLKSVTDLCIVKSQVEIGYWLRGRPLPQRPLVRYIEGSFRPLVTVAKYQILVRKN